MLALPRKRNLQEMEDMEKSRAPSSTMLIFEGFRDELDQHHDRRERIIKASRDITALSKKIIFSLQRVRNLRRDIPPKISSEIQERIAAIQNLFLSISPDLQGINAWRYQRQVSPGLQEFMEAVSFEHYLRTQTLITQEEAAKLIAGGVELTGDDYVLGIFDLVGELMRFSITSMALSGSLPGASEQGAGDEDRTILTDLRALRSRFEGLDTASCGGTGLGKDIEKKMEVMRTCVEKVEVAVYGITIRGSERPKGWMPDVSGDGPSLSAY